MTLCHKFYILSDTKYYINKIDEIKKELYNHQKSYPLWSQRKAELIFTWGENLEGLYSITGVDISKIAVKIATELKDMGIDSGGMDLVYKTLPQQWKNEEFVNLGKKSQTLEFSSDEQDVSVNFTRYSTEKQIDNVRKELDEAKEKLRSVKGKEKYLIEIKHVPKEIIRGKKKGPKITQDEPPEEMHKQGEMYGELEKISRACIDWHNMFEDIMREVEIYAPSNEDDVIYAQGVQQFHTYIDKLFSFFKPLKDRKWTFGALKWFKVQGWNIDHGKHAAGKKASVVILDGYGKPILDDKNREITRFMTRERVGDNEKPTYEMASALIESITGLKQMEDWLSKYQEGQRAGRKWKKAPDFSEGAFGSEEN